MRLEQAASGKERRPHVARDDASSEYLHDSAHRTSTEIETDRERDFSSGCHRVERSRSSLVDALFGFPTDDF